MLLNIASASNGSELKGVQDGDVQPNAVDVRIDKVFVQDTSLAFPRGVFALYEDDKQHAPVRLLTPNRWNAFGGRLGWLLNPGFYEISFANTVKLAEGEAGWVITRSTLVRNGLFITSGLYDSGYSGLMGAGLHVRTDKEVFIEYNARVGQFITCTAESLHLYEGSYGHGSEHDKKYEG